MDNLGMFNNNWDKIWAVINYSFDSTIMFFHRQYLNFMDFYDPVPPMTDKESAIDYYLRIPPHQAIRIIRYKLSQLPYLTDDQIDRGIRHLPPKFQARNKQLLQVISATHQLFQEIYDEINQKNYLQRK